MQLARQWRTAGVDWALALDHPTLDEPALRVDSIMSKNVFTCRASDSVAVAAQIMWDHDCGCVPVLDDAGTLLGMITDRDICMTGLMQGKRLADIPVASACSRKLYKCQSDELAGRAMQLMAHAQVRRLPVVDADGKLVGILSLNDLIRHSWFSRPEEGASQSVTEVGLLLEAVSRPRCRPQDELTQMSADERESLAQFDVP